MREKSESVATLALLAARSAALYFLLYHARLFVKETVGLAFMSAAFIAIVLLACAAERSGLRLLPALAATAALAWLVRLGAFAVVGAERTLFHRPFADLQLFAFDSSYLPLLAPLAVVWTLTFVARRSARFVPWEAALCGIGAVALFSTQASYHVTLYPHAGEYAAAVVLFVLIEAFVLMLSANVRRTDRRERAPHAQFLVVALPLIVLGSLLIFGRYTEGAVKRGGGLIKPTLLQFDFSSYVRLESDISQSDELVMLFRREGPPERALLRRYVLSGYRSGSGFLMERPPSAAVRVPLSLPDLPTTLEDPGSQGRQSVRQEYYYLNFDPSSLVAMNYPVRIIPEHRWNRASFSRIYSVVSRVPADRSWRNDAVEAPMDPAIERFYTSYGRDERVKALAERVTLGASGYAQRVQRIESYLLDNYLYSLHPGVARDGDQLHHFLFESKKGYCTYFAFAMALMCRSIGIPARVAVGFLVDPASAVLDFYPIRANMAHAWVEVYFGPYGWIDFDPTSTTLAPGERVETPSPDPARFTALVEEILTNRIASAPERSTQPAPDQAPSSGPLRTLLRTLSTHWYLLPLAYLLALLALRGAPWLSYGRARDGRGRVRQLYRIAIADASRLGFGRRTRETLLEHARRVDRSAHLRLTPLAQSYLASLFAPSFGEADEARAGAAFAELRASLGRAAPLPRRLLATLDPRRAPGGGARRGERPRPGRRARGRAPIVLLAFLLLTPWAHGQSVAGTGAAAPGERSPQWYAETAQRAIDEESYGRALSILSEGKARYPAFDRFGLMLGDLYSSKQLYALALTEYRAVAARSPGDFTALYDLATAEGRLNHDAQAVATLERLVALHPDHPEAVSDLGWMYFKTYQLRKGERLLNDALARYGPNRDMSVTLGTIYAGLYEYDGAKRAYQSAIDDALGVQDRYFASVGYYNLALLELGFYHYDAAMADTVQSLEMEDRAPGHVSKGELYEYRMELDRAAAEYRRAIALDSTPLAKISLAALYQQAGHLDEALAYLRTISASNDTSWMYYFGTDVRRHEMELHRIFADIYRGLAARERLRPLASLSDAIRSLGARIGDSLAGWYHEQRYRALAISVGRSYLSEGDLLDAYWSFYEGSRGYPPVALRYLRLAKAIELRVAPGAKPFYEQREGELTHDSALLESSLRDFDPIWEREGIAASLRALVPVLRAEGRLTEARDAANRLYELNPGALLPNGVRLPVVASNALPRRLIRLLTRSFDVTMETGDPSYRYAISAASTAAGSLTLEFSDRATGAILVKKEVQPMGRGHENRVGSVNEFVDTIYRNGVD